MKKTLETLMSLVVLAALAPLAPSQARWGEADPDLIKAAAVRPAVADGLMIATALGPPVTHPLPGHPWVTVQRVRVADSRAFAAGSLVDVYFEVYSGAGFHPEYLAPGTPISEKTALPVGRRVLLVAKAAANGALLPPDRNHILKDDAPIPLDSTGPAAYAKTYLLTAQARLADDPDPKWRLLGSLAAAIPGTSDENAINVADSIPSISAHRMTPFGGPDDRLSKLFVAAVANDTAYHRALVDLALNQLRYWGYADRFSRDLREAASDSDAFPDGLDGPFSFYEDRANNTLLPKDFKHDPPMTQDEILGVLARAKSPTIAAGYLHGLTTKPSNADVRSLARFLDSPDVRLRWAIVERLCAWYGGTPPEKPLWERREDGSVRTVENGLAEAAAAWKAKLATLLP